VVNDVHGVQGLGFELTYSCTSFSLSPIIKQSPNCLLKSRDELSYSGHFSELGLQHCVLFLM
jgi:hypothetical protein